MVTRASPDTLLRTVLRSVARSFYLTLAVVPSDVRNQVGVAYLLARSADTITDTDLIDRSQQLRYLTRFREWVLDPIRREDALREVQTALLVHLDDPRRGLETQPGERTLLTHLVECGHLLHSFTPADQALISQVVGTLSQGMQKDLNRFPGHLTTLDELDQYTYDAAGCVGDFWTRLMCAHRAALHAWDVEAMATVGIRFGKGLQLTNVLRDLAADLLRGRCYIPTALLEPAGLRPADLLDPAALPKFRPVLTKLLRIALEHLDQGWMYTMAIPRREVRLRLACAWPILFAVKTLQRVSASPSLLDPGVTLKMTRGEVYRIMALTTGALGCGRLLTGYYGHLRKRVAC
ncbi:MAG TPA: phytoene/squalene synthase family protein [Gemmatimonadales bacterium]|nr:phytoene/squalene synthase family protein [Gemmatimonadales bacterium]